MSRARILLPAAALAAGLAVAGGLFLALRGDGSPEGGPLATDPVAQGSGFPVDAGEPLTYAAVAVFNAGREQAVLERVSLVDAQPGVELVGALAAPTVQGPLVHAYAGFPPRRDAYPPELAPFPDLGPLAGTVLSPQPGASFETARTMQLYLGLRTSEPRGRVSVASFRLHYRVGDRRFELVLPHAVTFCSPRSDWFGERRCPTFLPGDR